ncbi:MAG TPA: hypothetical protein P5081_24065 [Phycisphaerae bacterium]|nr:hypothetical protein [Phycisphaerae bacterium]
MLWHHQRLLSAMGSSAKPIPDVGKQAVNCRGNLRLNTNPEIDR